MVRNAGNTMRQKEHFSICGEHINKHKNSRKTKAAGFRDFETSNLKWNQFLLSIITERTIFLKKKYNSLLKYMFMASRLNLIQHWKRDTLPEISDWEHKLGEYVIIT